MVDLGELVEFLILNQSLFNFRMTRFFTVNFPDKLYAEETQFVEKCQQLGLNSAWTSVSSSATPIPKGLTPKKYHEITRFAAFLANIIQQTPVDCIVDIGCGLGHLAKYVQEKSQVKLIGIDGQVQLCTKATETCSNDELSFHSVLIDSSEQCQKGLEQLLTQYSTVGLIGLHCCGDLHANLLRLFHRSDKIKFCVVVGCCYHKMKFCPLAQTDNFPMSSKLKSILTEEITEILRLFGLRLAAEQNWQMWSERPAQAQLAHFHNVYRRALLEVINQESNTKYPTTTKKCDSLEAYITAVITASNLNSSEAGQFSESMRQADKKFNSQFSLLRRISEMQFRLQSVLECLILQDRLEYLKESIPTAKNALVSLFNPSLSPRHVALLSIKS